jgi:hypothetical protein
MRFSSESGSLMCVAVSACSWISEENDMERKIGGGGAVLYWDRVLGLDTGEAYVEGFEGLV